jgi:hypothetical protein
MTTNHPTPSYPQRFAAAGLEEKRDNFFVAFQEQIRRRGYKPVVGKPFTIELMSGYQVHESPIFTGSKSVLRSFYRLDVTRKRFNDVRDTENPLLPRAWVLMDRSLSPALQAQETTFKSRVGAGGDRVKKENQEADPAVLDQMRRDAVYNQDGAGFAFANQAIRAGRDASGALDRNGHLPAGEFVYVGHDERGRDRRDPESKFVIVRDQKALGHAGATPGRARRDHIVAVATPDPAVHQPVHLHDVVDLPKYRAHLGRMLRRVLFAADGARDATAWQTTISLADTVTMPFLHAHGLYGLRPGQQAARRRDWLADPQSQYPALTDWTRVGNVAYRLWSDPTANPGIDSYPVWAVAVDRTGHPLTPRALADGAYDELLARMVLDVYRACEAKGLRHGQIEIDRGSGQVVVKAHVWPGKNQP